MQTFLHTQNLARYIDLLEVETDVAKRELLHKLLIEEADRFGGPSERLDQAKNLISQCMARRREQEALVAHLRDDGLDGARAATRLANMNGLLQFLEQYRLTLSESLRNDEHCGSAPANPPTLDEAQGEF